MNILTKYSSTLANDASYGSLAWFNIVSTPNSDSWGDSHAQTPDVNGSTSNYLKCTNFGFSIPTGSVISGITVELFAYGNSGTEIIKSCKLVKSNAVTGTEKGDNSIIGVPGGTVNSKVFGNSTDLWGSTWTAADISASNFGVVAAYSGTSVNSIVSFAGAVITINYIASQHNYTVSSGLILSKTGVINENFSADFGKLLKSNSNAGYAVHTGSDYVSGYVTRSNTFPAGYASPGMLYASCSANFESEMKFVVPSESANGATISMFFRIKNISNYRYLKLQWQYAPLGYYFFISDIAVVNDVVVSDSLWSSAGTLLTASINDIIIVKLRVVDYKSQLKFTNLNTSSYFVLENALPSPTIHARENGVGFAFDSNERIRYITSTPIALSFKPDYFTAASTSYENLGIKFNATGGLILSGTSLIKLKNKYSHVSSGSLTISGSNTFNSTLRLRHTSLGGVVVSGNSYSYIKSLKSIFTGGLVLSKVGEIDENFSVNFGKLKNTNSDAGYTVLGAGNGGSIGALSYDGFVKRNDVSPYAVPAILYAPSAPNFTAEIRFVCPSVNTGSLADLNISLFYRIQDSANYRQLKIGWYLLTPGGSRFFIANVISNNGSITESSWVSPPQMIADALHFIIFQFRVVDDQIQVIFNNLTSSTIVSTNNTLFSPSFLSKEGGLGFGFDSDEKLQQLNSNITSTSFKPDYFKALNIPYENLGGRFNTNGGLTLSGSSLNKIGRKHTSSGSLILSGSSVAVSKNVKFILDGNLILSGQAICITRNISYLIDYINNPLILSGTSGFNNKYYHIYNNILNNTLLISGNSDEFYSANYVSADGITTNGGLTLGGNAVVNYRKKYLSNVGGSLILGGDAAIVYNTKFVSSGGLTLGENAVANYKYKYSLISNSGLILSGNAVANYSNKYSLISNGGLTLSGNAVANYSTKYVFSGGLILGGNVIALTKTSYFHILSSGSLILDDFSLYLYSKRYIGISSGSLILSSTPIITYKFIYKYYPSVNLILTSNNLIKYGINLRYILGNDSLKLFGKSKIKNRISINNYEYLSNNIDINKVKLVSTKKEDVYLQWEIKDSGIISKFTNK